MKVIKISSGWIPSEAPHLQVGEAIEITDPRELLASGVVKEYVEVAKEEIKKEEPKDETKEEPKEEVVEVKGKRGRPKKK